MLRLSLRCGLFCSRLRHIRESRLGKSSSEIGVVHPWVDTAGSAGAETHGVLRPRLEIHGHKKQLADELERATGMEKKYLTIDGEFKKASVAARMSWMAGRTTQEAEDIAYSMLGIFNINMTPQYGEGIKAFTRLQRALLEASNTDESIFAWTIPSEALYCYLQSLGEVIAWAPTERGLLAPSPDCFATSGGLFISEDKVILRLSGGCRWTPQGVQFQMPIKAGTEATNMFGLPRKEIDLALNCWRKDEEGKTVTIRLKLRKKGSVYVRVECGKLDEKKGAKPSTNSAFGIDQALTRPLTVAQPAFDPYL